MLLCAETTFSEKSVYKTPQSSSCKPRIGRIMSSKHPDQTSSKTKQALITIKRRTSPRYISSLLPHLSRTTVSRCLSLVQRKNTDPHWILNDQCKLSKLRFLQLKLRGTGTFHQLTNQSQLSFKLHLVRRKLKTYARVKWRGAATMDRVYPTSAAKWIMRNPPSQLLFQVYGRS